MKKLIFLIFIICSSSAFAAEKAYMVMNGSGLVGTPKSGYWSLCTSNLDAQLKALCSSNVDKISSSFEFDQVTTLNSSCTIKGWRKNSNTGVADKSVDSQQVATGYYHSKRECTNQCEELSTTSTFSATYDTTANAFDLTGCNNGCSITTNMDGTGAAMLARTTTSTSITALSRYDGNTCAGGAAEAITVIPPLVQREKLGERDPTETVFNFTDKSTGAEVEYSTDVLSGDHENSVYTNNPIDNTADVISSSVAGSNVATSSLIDNEERTDIDKALYPNVDTYIIYQADSNGNQVGSFLHVYTNDETIDGVPDSTTDPDGSGSGSGAGSGDNPSSGDGDSSIDVSGVIEAQNATNQKLSDLLEQGQAGEVEYTGSCDNAAPVCDETKPFCQSLKADYLNKCSEYLGSKDELNSINDDPFNGQTELAGDFDILPLLQDVTNVNINANCPASSTVSFSIGSRAINLNFSSEPYCNFAQTIRPLVLFIGIFMIMRIFSRM